MAKVFSASEIQFDADDIQFDAPAPQGPQSTQAQLGELIGLRLGRGSLLSEPVGDVARGALGRATRERGFEPTGIAEKAGAFLGDPAIVGEAVGGPVGAAVGEGVRQGIGVAQGELTPREALKDVFRVGTTSAVTGGSLSLAGKFAKAVRPALVRFGSQLIRTTSGVPEKFGAAALSNPDILTKAPTMEAARKIYSDAIKGTPGAREFLLERSDDLIMSGGDATKIVNEAFRKLRAGEELGLAEALAARQSTSFLLNAAKLGNPEQRANLSNLMKAKGAFDDFLESGLPGFKNASRKYFEANARDAFSSVLPQNKNLSPNVLRGLGGLAFLSAGALMKMPFIIAAALPFSPKATGLGIRTVSQISRLAQSQAAQFAARASAIKAAQGD